MAARRIKPGDLVPRDAEVVETLKKLSGARLLPIALGALT
jgi:hypothetical protein